MADEDIIICEVVESDGGDDDDDDVLDSLNVSGDELVPKVEFEPKVEFDVDVGNEAECASNSQEAADLGIGPDGVPVVKSRRTQVKARVQSTCDICGRVYSSRTNLAEHMRDKHLNRRLKCEYCDETFIRPVYLKRHVLQKHSEKLSQSELESLQPVGKDYRCKTCERTFTSRGSYYWHLETHKGVLKFECKTCLHKCMTSSQLRRHSWIHDPDTIRCSKCYILFENTKTWRAHAVKKHENEEARPVKNTQASDTKFRNPRSDSRFIDGEGQVKIKVFERPKSSRDAELDDEVNVLGTMDAVGTERQEAIEESQSAAAGQSYYQCVLCNLLYLEKELLTDHFLESHPDLARSFKIPGI